MIDLQASFFYNPMFFVAFAALTRDRDHGIRLTEAVACRMAELDAHSKELEAVAWLSLGWQPEELVWVSHAARPWERPVLTPLEDITFPGIPAKNWDEP